MVKCPRCGYDNPASSMYCDNCAYTLTGQNVSRTKDSKSSIGWGMGIAKKIVIVLGIIVIALLLFSFINTTSQPDSQSSLNVITDNGSLDHSSSNPFSAVVKYNGTWYGQMGDPSNLVDKSGTGQTEVALDCSSWDKVYVEVQKEDSGEGKLTVQILRNGKVVAENSTTNATGKVSVSYNN